MRHMKYLKTISIISAVIIVIGLIFWKLHSNKKKKAEEAHEASISVATLPVTVYPLDYTYASQQTNYSNAFQANREVNMTAEVNGRVTEVFFSEGQQVMAGQKLVALDTRVASANLDQAQASLNKAKRDYERYTNLIAVGGVSQAELDQKTTDYENAKANYAKAQKALSDNYIIAPINGTIFKKYVEIGSFLSPGVNICSIVDASSLKLIINVPEFDLNKFKVNQKVTVKCSAVPGTEYTGEVTSIAVKADASLKYNVDIKLLGNSNNLIKPGMYGRVYLKSLSAEKMLLIPQASVVGSLENPSVFIVKDNIARECKIKVGNPINSDIQVTDGLKPGDKVVVSGALYLVDSSKVIITSEVRL
jgi:membrane fusion protein (multidrug efflux system)